MAQLCRHGVEMSRSCLGCGRIKMGSLPNLEAKKNGFLRSLDQLERTMQRLQTELANEPARRPAPPDDQDKDSAEPQPAPPAPPPQRYPWQRG